MKHELKKHHDATHRAGEFFPQGKAKENEKSRPPADDESTRLFREALKTLKVSERKALLENAAVIDGCLKNEIEHDGKGFRRKRGYTLFVEIYEPVPKEALRDFFGRLIPAVGNAKH
ncbi:MAG: hypothetical protein IKM45_01110 [Opitutales bacterium]|nr:hypothetical protein [Opitutales bacterium]